MVSLLTGVLAHHTPNIQIAASFLFLFTDMLGEGMVSLLTGVLAHQADIIAA